MGGNEIIEEIQKGEHLFENGNIKEALAVFQSIYEKEPNNLLALNDKGVALNGLGQYNEAIKTFLDVLDKDNNNSIAAFNLISNYFAIHKLEEAENVLSKYGHCLNQQDLLMIKRDLEKLQSIATENLSEDIAHSSSFDYETVQRDVNRVLNTALFFIMGVPKSGTTWLQYLLNAHPEILCSGEGNFNPLAKGLQSLVNDYNLDVEGVNRAIGTSNYVMFSQTNLKYLFVTSIGLLLSNLKIDPGVKCIGSKNPILIKELEIHASLLPSSKFIHIIREGRDVIVSAWFNNLRGNQKDTRRRWPDFKSFVEFGVQQWVSDIQKAQCFGQLYPERYIELRYEDLHRDPNPLLQKLLKFLGVDSSTSTVDQCRHAASFEKLSKGRKRGQEDRNTFFRKGIVGDWKNHFDQDALDIFMKHGSELSDKLGYL